MDYDMDSAFSMNSTMTKEGITVAPYDEESAFTADVPKGPKEAGWLPKSLRWLMAGSVLNQMESTSSYLRAIDEGEIPTYRSRDFKGGESIESWRADTKEARAAHDKAAAEFRKEYIRKEESMGVFHQIEEPMMLAVGSGFLAAPVKTAAIVGGFTIKDFFFNGRELMEEKFPDVNPNVTDAVEVLDMVVTGAILGAAVEPKFRAGIKGYLKKSWASFKDAKAAKIEAAQVKAVLTNPKTTTKQKMALLDELHIKYEQADLAIKTNKPILVSTEDLMKVTKDPAHAKAKETLYDSVKKPIEKVVKVYHGVPEGKVIGVEKAGKIIGGDKGRGQIFVSKNRAAAERYAGKKGKVYEFEVPESKLKEVDFGQIDPTRHYGQGELTKADLAVIKEEAEFTYEGPELVLPKIKGTGKEKVRGLAKGIEEKAVERGLTEGFGDLPEYKVLSMADQARKAVKFVENDPVKATNVAMGLEPAPKGITPEAVLIAVEDKLLMGQDVGLLRTLATESRLTAEATAMGQRIRTLGERNPESPIGAINKVQKARETKMSKGKFKKQLKKDVESIKKEIKKAAPKAKDWDSFLEGLVC